VRVEKSTALYSFVYHLQTSQGPWKAPVFMIVFLFVFLCLRLRLCVRVGGSAREKINNSIFCCQSSSDVPGALEAWA